MKHQTQHRSVMVGCVLEIAGWESSLPIRAKASKHFDCEYTLEDPGLAHFATNVLFDYCIYCEIPGSLLLAVGCRAINVNDSRPERENPTAHHNGQR